jgi:hypothetical protein
VVQYNFLGERDGLGAVASREEVDLLTKNIRAKDVQEVTPKFPDQPVR